MRVHGRWAPGEKRLAGLKMGNRHPRPPHHPTHTYPVSPLPSPSAPPGRGLFGPSNPPRGQTGVWAPRPHQGDDIPEGSASHICFFISVSLACFLPQGTRSLKSCGATLPQHLPPQLVVGGPGEGGGDSTSAPPGLGSSPPWGPPQTFLFPAIPSNPQLVHRRLTP